MSHGEIKREIAMPGILTKKTLTLPKKQVNPSGKECYLQCKCGNMNHFSVFVLPGKGELASVAKLVCLQCAHIMTVFNGVIQAAGTHESYRNEHA